MTAAPGSISPDQRLSIVRSCGKHKAVRSQNRSIIASFGLFTKVRQAGMDL